MWGGSINGCKESIVLRASSFPMRKPPCCTLVNHIYCHVCQWPRMSNQGLHYLASSDGWLARNEGMEKKMETTIMGYMGTTIPKP